MSSKRFHSPEVPVEVWSSPFVTINFGYPACCIQSLTDGSQGFSWAHWNTVETSDVLCTKGGFCMVLGSFQQQLLGNRCTSPTFSATTMLFLRACSHKRIKSRPSVHTNIQNSHQIGPEEGNISVDLNAIISALNLVQKPRSSALQNFILFYRNTSQRKKITK